MPPDDEEPPERDDRPDDELELPLAREEPAEPRDLVDERPRPELPPLLELDPPVPELPPVLPDDVRLLDDPRPDLEPRPELELLVPPPEPPSLEDDRPAPERPELAPPDRDPDPPEVEPPEPPEPERDDEPVDVPRLEVDPLLRLGEELPDRERLPVLDCPASRPGADLEPPLDFEVVFFAPAERPVLDDPDRVLDLAMWELLSPPARRRSRRFWSAVPGERERGVKSHGATRFPIARPRVERATVTP
ncbi:MAG: hypothetical protein SFZ23_02565 [Planctomycetota bacterium]|nr:hypothetical protein [Planctomycetota bacterium]